MTLSEMRRILAERDLQLTKSLGQNFLHDGNQLRRIVELAELSKEDSVLEIGPGLGPLTEVLLANAGKVLAIETDARLVEFLRQRFVSDLDAGRLELLHADALEWLRKKSQADWTGWKLVANLPYSVASPILVELAQAERGPERLVATLQAEVASRLMAGPGSPDYGVLTLLVQLQYAPAETFKIPATCFFPEPDVASACVCLKRREGTLPEPGLRKVFARIVKQGFSQRRKMMFKLLKANCPEETLRSAFETVGVDLRARAEQLGLEKFVQLATVLGEQGGATIRPDATVKSGTGLGSGDAPPEMSKAQSADELFDVVDAEDRVVGQRTRAEVHRLGLMHRATHALVFNNSGNVFLQKRSMLKDRQPGVWDSSASGHLSPGETYEAAAIRELKEEIGLQFEGVLKFAFKLAPSAETDQEHVWVYLCRAEGPFTLNPHEIETGGWYDPEELTRLVREHPEQFASAFRSIWERLMGEPHLEGWRAGRGKHGEEAR